jgi:S1-C subfamily serine protease
MSLRLRRLTAAAVLAIPVVAIPVAATAAVTTTADYGSTYGYGGYGSSYGYGGSSGYGSTDPGSYGSYGSYGLGGGTYGGYGTYGGSSTSTSTLDAEQASDTESTGVVLINTEVDYGAGEAAGTGLVLSDDGIVVTNHHVIADSTSITVTVPSTGKTYTADVVGYDAADDVAVLQLEDASGLTTVSTDTDGVSSGDAVTAVGNAEGGGTLLAADGTVTATGSDIQVSDDQGGTESLEDLIQVDADIVSGDSGGALLDSDGDVVGMNVAASSGSANVTGYAIPIDTVLDIATSIMSGETTGDIALGYDAALGVQLYSTSDALTVAGVVDGGAAADAGITAGSTITSFDGSSVTTADDLTGAIAKLDAGDEVKVGWTDSSGASHTATVTLGRAPVA